jgi:hypothetical protein
MAYSDKGSKRWGFLGCTMLLVIGLALLWLLLTLVVFPGPYTSAFPRPFDSAEWKRPESADGARCGMLADLRFRIGLKGKSRAEVAALLGPSQDENDSPGTSHWHLCPSFMDIWILEVRWLNDRVAEDWVRDT